MTAVSIRNAREFKIQNKLLKGATFKSLGEISCEMATLICEVYFH